MSAVTPPPTDDGGAAMAEAVDALIEAAIQRGFRLGTDDDDRPGETNRARARVLSVHAAARDELAATLARAEAAERAADTYASVAALARDALDVARAELVALATGGAP